MKESDKKELNEHKKTYLENDRKQQENVFYHFSERLWKIDMWDKGTPICQRLASHMASNNNIETAQ